MRYCPTVYLETLHLLRLCASAIYSKINTFSLIINWQFEKKTLRTQHGQTEIIVAFVLWRVNRVNEIDDVIFWKADCKPFSLKSYSDVDSWFAWQVSRLYSCNQIKLLYNLLPHNANRLIYSLFSLLVSFPVISYVNKFIESTFISFILQ